MGHCVVILRAGWVCSDAISCLLWEQGGWSVFLPFLLNFLGCDGFCLWRYRARRKLFDLYLLHMRAFRYHISLTRRPDNFATVPRPSSLRMSPFWLIQAITPFIPPLRIFVFSRCRLRFLAHPLLSWYDSIPFISSFLSGAFLFPSPHYLLSPFCSSSPTYYSGAKLPIIYFHIVCVFRRVLLLVAPAPDFAIVIVYPRYSSISSGFMSQPFAPFGY